MKSLILFLFLALTIVFTKHLPKTWEINSDEPLELSCHLSKPNVNVTWLRDGVPISDNSQAKNEGLRYSLYIPRGAEPGRYTIRLGGPSELESSCQVSILGRVVISYGLI